MVCKNVRDLLHPGRSKVYTHDVLIPAPALRHAVHERPSDTDWVIDSETDRQAVLEQLDRLLASPVFRGSKRLSGFLRFIVEQTLEDRGADLKERVIGVQVFGRAPDYDTSAEPVVRVSAGDLRKRIAQYYHDPGHENELRIDLPTGSYHPVFHMAPAAVAMENDALLAAAAELIRPPVELQSIREEMAAAPASRRISRRALLGYATAAAAGVAVTTVIALPGDPYEQFWGPVLAEKGSVLIFVGAGRQDDNRMVMEDALALVSLSGTLSQKNRAFRVLKASELNPETLKQGPSVLIGAFTNPLAVRLTQQLRFAFARDGEPGTGHGYIQDRQNLNRRDWSATARPRPRPRHVGRGAPRGSSDFHGLWDRVACHRPRHRSNRGSVSGYQKVCNAGRRRVPQPR